MTPEVKYLGIRSLKLQLFPNLVLFSNIICILQQLKMFFFFLSFSAESPMIPIMLNV